MSHSALLPRLKESSPRMQRIDQLAWTVGFSGQCFGIGVGLRANTPEGLELLRSLLPVGWRSSTSPEVDLLFSYMDAGPKTRSGSKRSSSLYFGAKRLARTGDQKVIADAFENKLQLEVAEAAPRHVFIHAGAVGCATPVPCHSRL